MKTREQTVMSGVSQYAILWPMWFKIIINDMDSGSENTFKKLADNPKLSGMVDPLGKRMSPSETLTDLRSKAHVNLMKLNKAKYKVLCLSQSNVQYQ